MVYCAPVVQISMGVQSTMAIVSIYAVTLEAVSHVAVDLATDCMGSNGRSCTGEEDILVVIDINSVMLNSSDINKCSENRDNCEQLCSNNAGSFTCSCRLGYLLASDGRSCIGEYCIN